MYLATEAEHTRLVRLLNHFDRVVGQERGPLVGGTLFGIVRILRLNLLSRECCGLLVVVGNRLITIHQLENDFTNRTDILIWYIDLYLLTVISFVSALLPFRLGLGVKPELLATDRHADLVLLLARQGNGLADLNHKLVLKVLFVVLNDL